MTVCPICGHDNRIGALICENCGADLYDSLLEQVSTKKLSSGQLNTRKFDELDKPPSSNPIVIYISKEKAPIAVERHGELILGRADDEHPDIQVDVDLSPYGGQEQGVSRQHMRLNAAANPPIITDLGSYNGTFVNGQKLIPDQPHILNSGDEVRLGRFVMRMYHK